MSSCLCKLIRSWTTKVIHKHQLAVHGGVVQGAACFATWVDMANLRLSPILAISLDLVKMFNMLSVDIAKQFAIISGLSDLNAHKLAWPIQKASSIWRLPHNSIATLHKNERGIPQGLASSVLMAELCVNCLVRKVVVCTKARAIAYVDDVTFLARSKTQLKAIIHLVLEFVSSFHLTLSYLKTVLWGTEQGDLDDLAKEFGFEHVQIITALGGDWAVGRHAPKPSYKKEVARIDRLKDRLLRAAHLPLHPCAKASLASVSALSLLDFLNPPSLQACVPLRYMVRKVVSQPFGAPEIIFNIYIKGCLDPLLRSLLAHLRLWSHVVESKEGRDVLEHPKLAKTGSRLAHVLNAFVKRGWELNSEHCIIRHGRSEREFLFRSGWNTIRRHVAQAMKDASFASLQDRRPSLYAGSLWPDWEHMRKFLSTLSAYDAAVLVKVWSGSLLTKSHRHTLNPLVSDMCDCELERQDLNHLLWFCPLYSIGHSTELKWWHTLEPACAQSLILPKHESTGFKRDWRRICKWALVVISRATKAHKDSPLVGQQDPMCEVPRDDMPAVETNGHLVLSAEVPYSYCAKCFITRCDRDRHFIGVKRCVHEDTYPCSVGEYKVQQRHLVRIEMHTWKTGAHRPRMVCQRCAMEQWATASFRSPCSKPLG